MRYLKKMACFVLCLLMVFSAVACGKTTDRTEPEANAVTEPATATAVPEAASADAEPTELPTETPTEEPAPDATEAFLALDKEMFEWYVTQDITYLDQFVTNPADYGIDETTVPVTMGEYTEAANTEWCDDCDSFLMRLGGIDKSGLSAQNQYAYDVIEQYLRYELMFRDTFYYYEPFEQYVGMQCNLPLTFGLYVFRDVQDVENYLTLMADLPRYMQQMIDFEKKRSEMGLFMTESALDAVLLDCQSIIDAKDTCYLYDTFAEELETLPDLTDEQKSTYIERSNTLVRDSYIKSYEMLYDALEALRPTCRTPVGAAGIDTVAKDNYAACIKYKSSSALEPQEAIDLLVKYAKSCYTSFVELYFADQTLLERSDAGDVISYGTIDEDIAYLKQLMAEYMPELPEVNVEYKDIPEEMQDSFSPAAYLVPSIDGWMDNIVLINPANGSDLMMLAHEAYPGHLFQFVYQRASDNESLFQRLASPIGYEEGWTTNVELSIAKRAEAFDVNYCLFEHYWSYFIYCLSAACSVYVNYMGYTEEQLGTFLADWGYEDYVTDFYTEAVNMPTYYFCYALGYCQQQEVYSKTYEVYPFTDKEFYTAYLNLGAGYFNLVEPAMLAWAENPTAIASPAIAKAW